MPMPVGIGRVLHPTLNADVDGDTAHDLASGLSDLAASVTEPGLGRAERLSRISRTTETANSFAAVIPLLDPYRAAGHSYVADLLDVVGRQQRGDEAPAEAVERLQRAQQYKRLARYARRDWADVAAIVGPSRVATTQAFPSCAQWLARYAVPAAGLGPADIITTWGTIPAATIDPGPDNPITADPIEMGGTPLPWTVSAYGQDVSLQRLDWATDNGAELELMFMAAVDQGLETELLAQLASAAPETTTFTAAESLVGATGWPADLVLVNPADAPTVRRGYSAELAYELQPTILATIGVTAGTAFVIASACIYLAASDVEWMVTDKPSAIGRDLVAARWGRAQERVPGAIAKVQLS